MTDNSKPINLTLGTTNLKETLIKALQELPDGYIVNMYGSTGGSATLVAAMPSGKNITVVALADYNLIENGE